MNSAEQQGAIALLAEVNALAAQYLGASEPAAAGAVLQSILQACAEHLSVDYALAYLEVENRLLCAPGDHQDEAAETLLLRMMRKDILLFESCTAQARVIPGDTGSSAAADEAGRHFIASHDRLVVCIPDALGRVGGVFAFVRKNSDGTPFGEAEMRLMELLLRDVSRVLDAGYDSDTGFLNSAGFYPRLKSMLASDEFESFDSCLLQIRFGQLISIGDSCGSNALQQAVVQLAAILEKRIRKRDLAARIGSSDFLLYLNKCSIGDAEALCEDLLDTLKGFRFSYKDRFFSINAFIGIVPAAECERDVRSLLEAGEDACTAAMNQGINGYCLYEPRQRATVRGGGLIVWPDRIIETLREEKLHLYSQPVVALKDPGRVDHHEVLLRIRSDNSLLVAPSVFVRVAERSRLIEQVDHWVIRNAFAKLDQHYRVNPGASVALSLNVSGVTLNERFAAFVAELMEDMSFQSDAIIFEVSEASAVSNMKHVVKTVKAMRRNGFRFSVDDFGSCMGSFTFLQNLAVDRLTIDGGLIRGITRSEINYSIVEAIQAVSGKMSLQTTAKLVDDAAVLEKLSAIGVDFIQGYLVSRAKPIEQLLDAEAGRAGSSANPA